MPPVIEAQGVTKRLPGVLANNQVNLTLERGEVHGLLGENGAGKSTLMNVLYGLYHADEGTILVKGQPVTFAGPNDAIRHGIGMVHQHFMLVPVMTVAENMMLGLERTRGNALMSAAVAAVLGGIFGYLLGGPLAGAFWLLAAGIYAALNLRKVRLPLGGGVAFGAVSGLLLGIVCEALVQLMGSSAIALPMWPVIGPLLGTLAMLRWLDKQAVAKRIQELSKEFGLELDPNAVISDLPVGIQQRVEIVKALYRDAEVLILDEPTAVLTPQEADDLFKIMRRLTERGVSIIFITHKLREVLAITDRITVLRRGEVVGSTTPYEATRKSLARMMVGREVLLMVRKDEAHPTDVVLDVQNLAVDDDRHHPAVKGVSFNVRAGEIVGIAGVQGNGQTELVEAITGLRGAKSGQVRVLDTNVTHQSPREVTALRTAHIPEDRQRHGLVLNYPVADNMILADYYQEPFSKGIILNEPQIEKNARDLVQQYDVRTPSIFTPPGSLSGGNQQKVIVARELSRQPLLLIASQPTRGLDVGSIEFIHMQIIAARDAGAGVLLVSAELDEVMSVSDRILVMYQGRVMAEVLASDATREQLGLLMAGIDDEGQRHPTPQPTTI